MKQLSDLRDEVALWGGLEQRIKDVIELSELNDPDLQPEVEKESGVIAAQLEGAQFVGAMRDVSTAISGVRANTADVPTASCGVCFQSITPMIERETDAMIVLPPIDPATRTSSPSLSVMIDGDIDERGALRGATALATGFPSITGSSEKSVSWLFSQKP